MIGYLPKLKKLQTKCGNHILISKLKTAQIIRNINIIELKALREYLKM